MDTGVEPRGVHLVGSVPLASSDAVFRAAFEVLGRRLRRIPDGETGARSNWIGWQFGLLSSNPQLELVEPTDEEGVYGPRPTFRLAPHVDPAVFEFGPLGYAEAALASFADFVRLRRGGELPDGLRFQVCLPTPLAPILAYVAGESQAVLEPVYERRLLAELDAILGVVPHDVLAVQWDTALEFAVLEGLLRAPFDDLEPSIIERLVRLGDQVPDDVELGYHLCYGDAGHKHFKEPDDTSKLVAVANALAADLRRRLDWVHLPVPSGRTDDTYYAPLSSLHLAATTELYLGLIHNADGEAGARERITVAQRVVSTFGVATECGLGRRPPETVAPLLELHAAVSSPHHS